MKDVVSGKLLLVCFQTILRTPQSTTILSCNVVNIKASSPKSVLTVEVSRQPRLRDRRLRGQDDYEAGMITRVCRLQGRRGMSSRSHMVTSCHCKFVVSDKVFTRPRPLRGCAHYEAAPITRPGRLGDYEAGKITRPR